MNKSHNIIDFTQKKNEKSIEFEKAVRAELMAEIIVGEIDTRSLYELLTGEGKLLVQQKMCN